MAERCPACGKSSNLFGETRCSRCGCDLSALIAIRRAAAHRLETSAMAMRRGDWQLALVDAEASWHLLHSAEAARLAFLAAVAQGDSETALHFLPKSLRTQPLA